jgi:hypothetical protein
MQKDERRGALKRFTSPKNISSFNFKMYYKTTNNNVCRPLQVILIFINETNLVPRAIVNDGSGYVIEMKLVKEL